MRLKHDHGVPNTAHMAGGLFIAAMALTLAACTAATLSSSPSPRTSAAPTATPSLTTPAPSASPTSELASDVPSAFPPANISQCARISPFAVMALGPFDVIAEFELTPAGFLAWHDQFIRATGVDVGQPGPGVSPWPFTSGGDGPVTVCYLRGSFLPHGSAAPGGPSFADEAVAVLNGSSVELIAVGSREGLPLVTPRPAMAIPSGCVTVLPSAAGPLASSTVRPSFPIPSPGC